MQDDSHFEERFDDSVWNTSTGHNQRSFDNDDDEERPPPPTPLHKVGSTSDESWSSNPSPTSEEEDSEDSNVAPKKKRVSGFVILLLIVAGMALAAVPLTIKSKMTSFKTENPWPPTTINSSRHHNKTETMSLTMMGRMVVVVV